MSRRLAKEKYSGYGTQFDIQRASKIIAGLIEIAPEGYSVISTLRIYDDSEFSVLHDEAHLVIIKNEETWTVWDSSENPIYLGLEAFTKKFARNLKAYYQPLATVVALHTFLKDPGLGVEENLEQPYYTRCSWYAEEFLNLPHFSGSSKAILPPGFRDEDEYNEEYSPLYFLTPLFNGSSEDSLGDSATWFVTDSGEGAHNVYATWETEDGETVGTNALVKFINGQYIICSGSAITGDLSYSLFTDNLNYRLVEGLPMSVIVQTFDFETIERTKRAGDDPYIIRGWSVENGVFTPLELEDIREAVSHADYGDLELEYATFAKGSSLDLVSQD